MLLFSSFAHHHAARSRALLLASAALMLTACGGAGKNAVKTTPDPYAPVTTGLDFPTEPVDKKEYQYSGAKSVDAETIWNKGYNGKGVLIGMIDSGLDLTHPEFEGRIHPNSKDFGTNGPLDVDMVGHGTHVAGIMVANRNKQRVVGIAYGATLLVAGIEICKSDGTCGGFDLTNAVKGMQLMIDNKVRVVNQSYTKAGLSKEDAAVTTQATANGMIVVTSAGNDHGIIAKGKMDVLAEEVSHGLVLHVGALDGTGKIADYSDKPGDEGIAKYHFICAMADLDTFTANRPGSPSFDIVANGTSMAAPVVTASIALLIQAWPKLPPKDIVDLVFRTADDLGEKGVDGVYGWGKINLVRAFSSVGKTFFAGTTTSYDPASPTGFSGPAWGNGFTLTNGLRDVIYTDSYQRDFKVDLGTSLITRPDSAWLANSLQHNSQTAQLGDDHASVSYSFAQSPLGYDRATQSDDQRDLRAGYAPAAMTAVTATWQATPALALGFAKGTQIILPQALNLSIQTPAMLAADTPDIGKALLMQGSTQVAAATTLSGWRIGAMASRAQSGRSALRWNMESQLNSYSLHALRRFGPLTSAFSLSWQQEQGGMMGLTSRNVLGLHGATHMRATSELGYTQGGWQISGQFSQGLTQAQLGSGLIQQVRGLQSQGWRATLARTGLLAKSDQLRLGVAQPMRIVGGTALLNIPTAWDIPSRTAEYNLRHVGLAPDGHERDMELAYTWPMAIGTLDLNFVYRDQPGHIAAAPDDKAVALRWSSSF